MKIVNKPNNIFFENFYKELDKFIEVVFKGKGIKLNIKNIIQDDEFFQKECPDIGLMYFRANKKGINYRIEFRELSSLAFVNFIYRDLIRLRYGSYLDNLGIKFCGEVVSILVLLHELGHIDQIEQFLYYLDDDGKWEPNTYTAFKYNQQSIHDMLMKPWDMKSLVEMTLSNITFNSVECYAELFSLKYFPYFINFLKENGFGID